MRCDDDAHLPDHHLVAPSDLPVVKHLANLEVVLVREQVWANFCFEGGR